MSSYHYSIEKGKYASPKASDIYNIRTLTV